MTTESGIHTVDYGEEAVRWVGSCRVAPEDLREVPGATGACAGDHVIRPGWFAESFRSELPASIAMLHCDADWYDSVLLVLRTLYPRVSPGGCVVLDDFGYWEGCRRAFYAFCRESGEEPLLERTGITQAHWIKGKAHNRDG